MSGWTVRWKQGKFLQWAFFKDVYAVRFELFKWNLLICLAKSPSRDP